MRSSNRVFEGKDLEEALLTAAAGTGIAEPDLDYEILEQGRRGLFGIGARKVRIRVKPPVADIAEPEPPRPDSPAQAETPAPAPAPRKARHPRQAQQPPRKKQPAKGRSRARNRGRGKGRNPGKPVEIDPANIEQFQIAAGEVRETLQRMVELMGLSLDVQARAVDSGVTLELDGEDRKLLTARDGELISALQFLLNRMARRAWPAAGRIHLSANGGRKHRDEELVALTREVTQQVSSTGKTKRLHPMNAYERRLVHITVRERPELGSRSEGNGYLKRVRIYKNPK